MQRDRELGTVRFTCVKVVNQVGDKSYPFKRDDPRQHAGDEPDIRAVLRASDDDFPATLSVFRDAAKRFVVGQEYVVRIVPVDRELASG
jgi:hypothetical protein